MARPILTYTIDDHLLQEQIQQVLTSLSDLTPAMETIGEMGAASIQQNFEQGGRPQKWKDLAESTKAERRKIGKWPGLILVRKGELKRVTYQAEKRKVSLLPAAVPQAAILHFGGKAGRGHKVTIPKREYMLLQTEDYVEVEAILAEHVFEHLRR